MTTIVTVERTFLNFAEIVDEGQRHGLDGSTSLGCGGLRKSRSEPSILTSRQDYRDDADQQEDVKDMGSTYFESEGADLPSSPTSSPSPRSHTGYDPAEQQWSMGAVGWPAQQAVVLVGADFRAEQWSGAEQW